MSVSVIIPTYNGERFIREALGSVFAQTLPPCEIIVVDDCSKDDTVDVVKEVSGSAPIPVRLIELEQNSGGPARPINIGVAEAVGEFVAVLDQDDQFTGEKLKEEIEYLTRHRDASFAFSNRLVKQSGRPDLVLPQVRELLVSSSIASDDSCHVLDSETLLRMFCLHGCFVGGFPGFTFRRAAWESIGKVDESLGIAADFDFLARLTATGNVIFVDEVHYIRNQHGNNLTNAQLGTFIEECEVKRRILSKHRELLEDLNVALKVRAQLTGGVYYARLAGDYSQAQLFHRTQRELFGYRWKDLRSQIVTYIMKSCHSVRFRQKANCS